MASTTSNVNKPHQQNIPLFDFFLDLPHPCASDVDESNGHTMIQAPQQLVDSNTVCKELTDAKNLGHITRLCFPDFSDVYHESLQLPPPAPTSAGLNKYDTYLSDFQTHQFKFTIQSSLGLVVGHTRTYIPSHKECKGRADVGRRGHRSLVLLTRNLNYEKFCASVLKTVEAMLIQKSSCPIETPSSSVQMFLHTLIKQHIVQQHHQLQQQQQQQQPQSLSITLPTPGLEFGQIPYFLPFDEYFFIPPPPSFNKYKSSPILPLLRCLEPTNTVRLLSALMCERRIIFLSSSPTRLAECVSSATSILTCGMLSWPHIVIPVLPPHQFPALGTKVKPYIVGVITKCARECRIDQIPGVEDVVMFDLDQVGFVRLLGAGGQNLDRVVPDLLRGSVTDGNPNYVSLGETLAQDLAEIHKNDKFKYTSNLAAAVQNIAKKGGATVKNVARAIGRFAASRKASSVEVEEPNSNSSTEHEEIPPDPSPNSVNDDVQILMQNELGEDDLISAFVSFYLNLFGGGHWYITNTGSGLVPDVNKFLDQRRKRGDTQGTAMYPLIYLFVQTKIFQIFAHARISDMRSSMKANADSPLFFKCVEYMATHQLNYSPFDVRRIVKQMTQNSSKRQQMLRNEAIRNVTLSITSNRPYEGNLSADISKLTKTCRITTTKLVDVMDILWMRLRSSKTQWKPALLSLYVLRNLILHGPITAISEAMAGFDKIRSLKTFQSSNKSNSAQIQTTAKNVYELLVDRPRLFTLRRAYATRRRVVSDPKLTPSYRKVTELLSAPTFMHMHQFLRPKNTSSSAINAAQTNDLLDFSAVSNPSQTENVNISYTNDLLSFGSTGTNAAPNQHIQAQGVVESNSINVTNTAYPQAQANDQLNMETVTKGQDPTEFFAGIQQQTPQQISPFDLPSNQGAPKDAPSNSATVQPVTTTTNSRESDLFSGITGQNMQHATPFDSLGASVSNSNTTQPPNVFDLGTLKTETANIANTSNPFNNQSTQRQQTTVVSQNVNIDYANARNNMAQGAQHSVTAQNQMYAQHQGVNSQYQQGYTQQYYGGYQQQQPNYGQNVPYNKGTATQGNAQLNYTRQQSSNVHNNPQQQNTQQPTANPYWDSQQHQRAQFQRQQP